MECFFYVNYVPPPNKTSIYTLEVGAEPLPSSGSVVAKEMPNKDLPGSDYNVTNVDYHDFHECEAACNADSKCSCWTYVIRPPKYASCCLKQGYPKLRAAQGMTSGVKNPKDPKWPKNSGTVDTLRMSPNDKTITIRAYVDNTFTEAFWQNGRVAMTITTGATKESLMAVSSTVDIEMNYAKAWQVKPIWVSPEEVIRTPRMDGKPI